MSDLFPGFDHRRIPVEGIEINARIGGAGPPLLLIHGYPETHACWHRLAPQLAETFRVVLPDLPGYGDSGFLEPDEANRRYSKRNMAAVMVALMRSLGHERFRLVGRHDFTSFRSSLCQAASPLKTLDRLEVEQQGEEIRIRAAARSFLHHQVRNMAGSLKLVGEGRWSADDIAAALAARDRRAAGPTAPPEGLFLTEVRYPP